MSSVPVATVSSAAPMSKTSTRSPHESGLKSFQGGSETTGWSSASTKVLPLWSPIVPLFLRPLWGWICSLLICCVWDPENRESKMLNTELFILLDFLVLF